MASDLLQPAPFGDEERDRLGAAPHGFEFDALVEAVDRSGVWPVAESGNAGLEAEETRSGGARGGGLRECFAEGLAVRAAEQGDRLLAVLEHVTLRLEAVIDDLRRIVGEEAVGPRGVADRRLDLALGRGDLLAGIDGDADVEDAPGRHARRPVSAFDPADIEIDRVLDRLIGRVVLAPRIPRLFEPVQRLYDWEGGLDRVGAGARLADMNRNAADTDLEPEDADLGADQLVPHRLGDQCGVGAIAAVEAAGRPLAGAFPPHHPFHLHTPPPP